MGFTTKELEKCSDTFSSRRANFRIKLMKESSYPTMKLPGKEATSTCGEMIKELDGKLKAGPDGGWK
jgi:hypothetical protein